MVIISIFIATIECCVCFGGFGIEQFVSIQVHLFKMND